MALRPAGVVFVNNDLTTSVQNALVKQLHISEVVDGYSFDNRIIADSSYIAVIKQFDLRIMVVRSFEELDNRGLADVVIFVSSGLAAVLKNNFGPPNITMPVARLTWNQLGVFS
ncbi:MAG: hypothetical protein Q8P20_09455 [bacterium]|nr:hypothetical protein [bacterium]